MKTGGRLVKHARYYWLLLAEGHLNRKLFGEILGRIWALPGARRVTGDGLRRTGWVAEEGTIRSSVSELERGGSSGIQRPKRERTEHRS
jgi:hypothetical protein